MTQPTRRRFLAVSGSMATVSVAGCAGNMLNDQNGDDIGAPNGSSPNDTPTPEEEEEETPTPEDERNDEDELIGESIDDFEDLENWFAFFGQGEIEGSEDDVYAGSQSAVITAEADVDFAGVYREFLVPIDLHDKNLSLALKYTGRELFDLTVQVLAPNSQNYISYRRVLTGPSDRWMRIDLGANYDVTQPDLYDVREIRIIGRRRGDGSGPIEFAVDDLRAVDRPDTGYVMLMFDGTLDSHYDVAFDIIQEYGYAGVETIIPETVDNEGRLQLHQMREMRDEGWDMIARPRVGAQYMYEYTRDEQEGMIRRTQTYLINRGFEDGARHFFTPRNILGPDSMDLVREYHDQAFRFGGAPNGIPTTDPHNLNHFSGNNGEDTRLFIDLAGRYKQLAIPLFGDIGEEGMSEDAFRDLLDYVEDADVEVITATGLLEL